MSRRHEMAGCTRVLLKADNERPIVRLLVDCLRRLRIEGLEQVAQEAPTSYDFSSIGRWKMR